MKVTCEINDYSIPGNPRIKICSVWTDSTLVELEIRGDKCRVNADELIAAISKCSVLTYNERS